jgi:uncharacterized membrane protein AbrB (regulator of aidB expression)
MLTSKAFSMDLNDLVSVGKNALLVGIAAVLTYIGENMANIDLGSASVLVVPIVVVMVNTIVSWIEDHTKSKKK